MDARAEMKCSTIQKNYPRYSQEVIQKYNPLSSRPTEQLPFGKILLDKRQQSYAGFSEERRIIS